MAGMARQALAVPTTHDPGGLVASCGTTDGRDRPAEHCRVPGQDEPVDTAHQGKINAYQQQEPIVRVL